MASLYDVVKTNAASRLSLRDAVAQDFDPLDPTFVSRAAEANAIGQGGFVRGFRSTNAGEEAGAKAFEANLLERNGADPELVHQMRKEAFALASEAQAIKQAPEFTKIRGLGQAADYLAENAGSMVSSAIPSVAGGLGGAATGAALGSIVPGIGTAIGATIGGIAGGVLPSYNMNANETAMNILSDPEMMAQSADARVDAARKAGALMAIPDAIVPGRIVSTIAKPFIKEAGKEVAKKFLVKDAAKSLLADATIEGGTEALQTGIQGKVLQELDPTHEITNEELINAGAAGFFGGGAIGAGHAGLKYAGQKVKDLRDGESAGLSGKAGKAAGKVAAKLEAKPMFEALSEMDDAHRKAYEIVHDQDNFDPANPEHRAAVDLLSKQKAFKDDSRMQSAFGDLIKRTGVGVDNESRSNAMTPFADDFGREIHPVSRQYFDGSKETPVEPANDVDPSKAETWSQPTGAANRWVENDNGKVKRLTTAEETRAIQDWVKYEARKNKGSGFDKLDDNDSQVAAKGLYQWIKQGFKLENDKGEMESGIPMGFVEELGTKAGEVVLSLYKTAKADGIKFDGVSDLDVLKMAMRLERKAAKDNGSLSFLLENMSPLGKKRAAARWSGLGEATKQIQSALRQVARGDRTIDPQSQAILQEVFGANTPKVINTFVNAPKQTLGGRMITGPLQPVEGLDDEENAFDSGVSEWEASTLMGGADKVQFHGYDLKRNKNASKLSEVESDELRSMGGAFNVESESGRAQLDERKASLGGQAANVSEVGAVDAIREQFGDNPALMREAEDALLARHKGEGSREDKLAALNAKYKYARTESFNDGDASLLEPSDVESFRKKVDGGKEDKPEKFATPNYGTLYIDNNGEEMPVSVSALIRHGGRNKDVDHGKGGQALLSKLATGLSYLMDAAGSGKLGFKPGALAKVKWLGDGFVPSKGQNAAMPLGIHARQGASNKDLFAKNNLFAQLPKELQLAQFKDGRAITLGDVLAEAEAQREKPPTTVAEYKAAIQRIAKKAFFVDEEKANLLNEVLSTHKNADPETAFYELTGMEPSSNQLMNMKAVYEEAALIEEDVDLTNEMNKEGADDTDPALKDLGSSKHKIKKGKKVVTHERVERAPRRDAVSRTLEEDGSTQINRQDDGTVATDGLNLPAGATKRLAQLNNMLRANRTKQTALRAEKKTPTITAQLHDIDKRIAQLEVKIAKIEANLKKLATASTPELLAEAKAEVKKTWVELFSNDAFVDDFGNWVEVPQVPGANSPVDTRRAKLPTKGDKGGNAAAETLSTNNAPHDAEAISALKDERKELGAREPKGIQQTMLNTIAREMNKRGLGWVLNSIDSVAIMSGEVAAAGKALYTQAGHRLIALNQRLWSHDFTARNFKSRSDMLRWVIAHEASHIEDVNNMFVSAGPEYKVTQNADGTFSYEGAVAAELEKLSEGVLKDRLRNAPFGNPNYSTVAKQRAEVFAQASTIYFLGGEKWLRANAPVILETMEAHYGTRGRRLLRGLQQSETANEAGVGTGKNGSSKQDNSRGSGEARSAQTGTGVGTEGRKSDAEVKNLNGVPAVKAAERNGEGVDVLRKTGTHEHYGNPFTSRTSSTSAEVKVASVKEAVAAYRAWLAGTAHQEVRPEQRKWILEQVNSGVLDGKTLLYYTQLNEPSHADALADFVNARKLGAGDTATEESDADADIDKHYRSLIKTALPKQSVPVWSLYKDDGDGNPTTFVGYSTNMSAADYVAEKDGLVTVNEMSGSIKTGESHKTSNQTPEQAAQAMSPEEEKSIRDTITKMIGKDIVNFPDKIPGNLSGEWTPMMIKVALNAGDRMGVAFHESMHQLFKWMRDNGSAEVRQVLENAATNHVILNKLRRELQDHPAALQQIAPLFNKNAKPADVALAKEEAVAYLFQFWANGKITLGAKTETLFQKLNNYIRRVLGLLSEQVKTEEMAAKVLKAFKEGEFAEDPAKRLNSMYSELKVMQASEFAGGKLWNAVSQNKFMKNAVYTAGDVLRDTKNPYFIKIANQFAPATGEKLTERGVLEATSQEMAKRLNTLAGLMKGLDKEDMPIILQHMRGKTPTNKIADPVIQNKVRELRNYLEDMHTYMSTERGVQQWDDEAHEWRKLPKRDMYFPVVWEVDKLIDDPKGFKDLLLKHHSEALLDIASRLAPEERAAWEKDKASANPTGYRPGELKAAETVKSPTAITAEDVAEAIVTRLIKANGQHEIGETGSSLGITPFAKAINKRTLNFIDDYTPFAEYMNNDLAGTMTAYTAQAVKRAEYTHVFGNEGEKLQQAADAAWAYEYLNREQSQVSALEAKLPAALEQWKKEAAKAYAKGDPVPEKPNLRVMAQDSLKLSISKEEADKRGEQANKVSGPAVRAIMAGEGTIGRDIDEATRAVVSGMMTYQAYRLLPLSLFTSLIDPLGIVVRGGNMKDAWDAFVRGVREVRLGWKDQYSEDDAAQFAESIGAADAHAYLDTLGQTYGSMFMTRRMNNLNNALFKWNGMESWNRAMRIHAANVAKRVIEANLLKPDSKHAKRHLGYVGLDDGGNYLIDGKLDLTNEKVQQAIVRWTNGAILKPNAMQRPILASDPHYILLYQLKQFAYSFHKTILAYAATEAKEGNYNPVIGMAATYIPFMVAADVLKGVMVSLLPGADEPAWMKKGIGDYFTHGFMRANLMGVPQMPIEAMVGGFKGNLTDSTNLLGPSVDQIAEILAVPFSDRHTVGSKAVDALPGAAILSKMTRDLTRE